MNYFELFGIPVSLKVDTAKLNSTYFALQKKYHPDFHGNASDVEKEEILEKSSAINKAWKIFKDADATIQYVLMEKGLLEEEEKYKLSQDFLMEMMELNEQLMDAKMEEDLASISNLRNQLNQLSNTIYAPVTEIVEHYKEGITTKEELLQVKDCYYRKKYLKRILEGLG